jgi:hypothetical protein
VDLAEGSVEAPDHLFELPEFFSAGHTGARYAPPARRTTKRQQLLEHVDQRGTAAREAAPALATLRVRGDRRG